ncbi:MAG: SurA N-terminal domain-containing protein [Balneolaceae bacterium]|nr:SurA N-terminal domain-containing protein [Balneolaceae bacterium]
MGVMEKMRKSTGIILWVLIFSFGVLWMLQDTRVFEAMGAGPGSLGEVNGEAISIDAYNNRVSYYVDQYSQRTGNSITPEQRAFYEDQAWEDLVTSILIQQKMDELGIKVTDQEVVNMITGENPDPFIRQQFQREDGTIDRVALQNAIESPENSQIWISIEQQLRQKRRQQKMSNYVQSAMQVSSYEVEQQFIRNNTFADISFVRYPYAEISEEELSVTEDDLREYYNNNKEKYQRNESYRFEYVSFDTKPTKEDTTRTINEMKNLRSDFASAESDSLFLTRYQSTTPYSAEFVDKDEVRDIFKPVLDLENGEVSDVIKSGGKVYTLKKLDETASEVKFVVMSFDITADPIATVDKRAEEADDFSFFAEQDGFEEEAERRDLQVKEAFATKDNPFVAGIGQSIQILNFLESADEGDISGPLELSNQFVVVKLNELTPEGPRPFEEVESQIRTLVTTQKRKDKAAQKVTDWLASNSDLEVLAQTAGTEVQTADDLALNASVISVNGGSLREPRVIGALFEMEAGQQSGAIQGNNAVYVVRVDERQDANLDNLNAQTRQQIRQQLQQQKSGSFTQVWLDQLKEQADIEDYRDLLLQRR